MKTEEVVHQYYHHVNHGEWDKWLALFDDNLEMDEQLGGRVEGIETLRKLIGGITQAFPKFKNHPQHVVINDHEAGVVSRLEVTNATGKEIAVGVVNYFRIKHGKIVYMANFHDTRPFAD